MKDDFLSCTISEVFRRDTAAYNDYLEYLASLEINPDIFKWFAQHFLQPPPPPPPRNVPHPLFSKLPQQVNPFLIPGNIDPFNFRIPANRCKTNNICGNVNITFDVRVGDISHCKANKVEPRQNVKNLLILTSHYYNCLKITTKDNTPNSKHPGNEILNSVDGIANTRDNEWVIYLNRTKKYVDLNKYLPSNGDYFVINYAVSNKI
ncbi:unnamed protein product [Acanthosepion pharaonis]|uniref:Uncharacterized protein n=1 Tax=Acanthosepion pharaonis TaxID=158019 RepID=A0A812E990_ACAPH|nr:unnamed protein product [Sepia pharaonis]